MKIYEFLKKNTSIKNFFLKIYNTRVVQWLFNYGWMNDKAYIKYKYKKIFGVTLDLDSPKTFNEKNNWRKLHDRKNVYTRMVDKYRIKSIIAEKLGEKYTFPLYGVWDDPRDIEFSKLPNTFVLKVNHAGGVIVCRDRSTFNQKKAIKELRVGLKDNFFIRSREWPYKEVDRKVIAEQYMGENLIDYKNYCFNGRVEYTFVWKNVSREDGRKPQAYFCGAYDRNWNRTDIEIKYPTLEMLIEKPNTYDEMIRVAEVMSKDIPFVRVDCYIINNNVYVGETTFFPWGGFMRFKDEKWNLLLGEMQKLP